MPRWRLPFAWGSVSHRVRMRGLHQRRRLAWRSIAIALILLLPTGCLTAASSVVGTSASAVGAYFEGAEKGEPTIVTPRLSRPIPRSYRTPLPRR